MTCWFYNQTWRCLSCTLSQASYKELGLLALVVIMGMLIFSGLTFVVEKDANPDEFISLPAALYWAIITMTSVCAFFKTSLSDSLSPRLAMETSLPKHGLVRRHFSSTFCQIFFFIPFPDSLISREDGWLMLRDRGRAHHLSAHTDHRQHVQQGETISIILIIPIILITLTILITLIILIILIIVNTFKKDLAVT